MDASTFIALCSFPKSGNTWVRTFLAHLLAGGDVNAIPDKYRSPLLSGRAVLFRGGWARIYKTHDRLISNINADREISHAAYVYILRHPLDVFLSQANYISLRPEQVSRADLRPGPWNFSFPRASVEALAHNGGLTALLGAFMTFGTLMPNFQSAGSWFDHAETWSQRDDAPPLLRLRYEDMAQRGLAAFVEIAAWFGGDAAAAEAAFHATGRDTAKDDKFFWRQKALGYRDILTAEQIALFGAVHAERVARAGYDL